MKNNAEKLSLSTKIGFGMGDIYGGGAMMFIGIYYLYFLTDIIKLNPSLAGIVILISKIWDAVNDPIMGVITDRTRTKLGRRRPYLLAGIIFIFISYFLLWYPVSFQSELGRFIFVLLAYIFFDTVLTMVMVPYNALASELTLDYHERTLLTSIRMFFSMTSSLICAVIPLEIIKLCPDVRMGHIVMGISFGLFFALPFIATYMTTQERPEFQKTIKPFTFKDTYIAPFKIKTFNQVMLLYLLSFLAMDILMSIIIYYMTYYIKRGNETNYVLGALLVAQIVVIPLYYYISKKTSKKTGIITALCFWSIVMLFSFLITPNSPKYAMYIFGSFVGIATGGVVVMIYSIFPDIPDVDELVSGQRREGIYMGLYVFMRKLSSALAIFIISQAISLTGYVPPIHEKAGSTTQVILQGQSETFIMALRIIFAAVPLILIVIAIYVAFRYQLTPSIHERLKKHLEQKRMDIAPSQEFKNEDQFLYKLLV